MNKCIKNGSVHAGSMKVEEPFRDPKGLLGMTRLMNK